MPFLPQPSPHLLPPPRPSFPPQPPSTTPPQLPIKKLTFVQLQERKATDLYYNCDAKKFPGHKCNSSRFLLLLNEDLTLEHPTNTSPHIFSNPQFPPFFDPGLDFSNPELTILILTYHSKPSLEPLPPILLNLKVSLVTFLSLSL